MCVCVQFSFLNGFGPFGCELSLFNSLAEVLKETKSTRKDKRKTPQNKEDLRVVFPPTEPRKPPGRKSPKNGEKLHNSPPRSNPRKWENITEKLQKILRKYIFCNFSVLLPIFGGWTGEGNFVIFPHFSRISAPGLPGLCKGKNNSQRKTRKKTSAAQHRKHFFPNRRSRKDTQVAAQNRESRIARFQNRTPGIARNSRSASKFDSE